MNFLVSVTPLILAGGLGTRLRDAVPGLPKVLVPVHGRPFLTYLLDQLYDTGLRTVVLSTGYLAEMVNRQIGSHCRGIAVHYSQEEEPLGTGGALGLALASVDTDNLLVMNGDSFLDTDLAAFLAWHVAHDLEASLLLTRVEDTGRFGRVELGPGNRVMSFQEKQATADPGLINSGIYLLRRRLLEQLPSGVNVSLEYDLFPELVSRGLLHAFPVVAPFIDIGTPETYAEAERFFACRQLGLPQGSLPERNRWDA